jgi:hypothetical protein
MVACAAEGSVVDGDVLHQLLHFDRSIRVDAQSTTGLTANCDATERLGVAAMMIAAARGDKHAVHMLLSRGASLTLLDGGQQTVFSYAINQMHLEVLHTLILVRQCAMVHVYCTHELCKRIAIPNSAASANLRVQTLALRGDEGKMLAIACLPSNAAAKCAVFSLVAVRPSPPSSPITMACSAMQAACRMGLFVFPSRQERTQRDSCWSVVDATAFLPLFSTNWSCWWCRHRN